MVYFICHYCLQAFLNNNNNNRTLTLIYYIYIRCMATEQQSIYITKIKVKKKNWRLNWMEKNKNKEEQRKHITRTISRFSLYDDDVIYIQKPHILNKFFILSVLNSFRLAFMCVLYGWRWVTNNFAILPTEKSSFLHWFLFAFL